MSELPPLIEGPQCHGHIMLGVFLGSPQEEGTYLIFLLTQLTKLKFLLWKMATPQKLSLHGSRNCVLHF